MSEHAVRIIEIGEVRPHENADRLGIVPVGGWSCVVAKEQFKAGDRAIYIEPDYVVPTERPEFAFLAKDGRCEHRLKAIRLRGVISFGLLIPVPDEFAGHPVGADVMQDLGIYRYEPPVKCMRPGSDDTLPAAEWPQVYASKFDVEDLRKHEDILQPGERVIVTEKIHGGNARYLFWNDKFYIGSRTRWLQPNMRSAWTMAANSTPEIEQWCRENPGVVLYGEVYGPVQELRYGLKDPQFVAFAALMHGEWWHIWNLHHSLDRHGVPYAPVLYDGPYDREHIAAIAEKDSQISTAPNGHMMEGVVIVPYLERRHERIGRVCLKLISNRYWLS
jgi:RNA ligase (TIGR02306 family)